MTAPKKPEPARQAGALVFGTTLATLSTAITPMLVTRLIAKPAVGSLTSTTFAYETVAMLLAVGLPATTLYQLSNKELGERAAIARRIAVTASLIGAGGAVLVALFALAAPSVLPPSIVTPTFREQLRLLLILAPSLVADLPFRLLPNILIAEGRARRQAGLQVVRAITLTLATLVPLSLKASVTTVVVAYACVRAAFGLFVLWEFRALYGRAPRGGAPIDLRALFRFALPLGFTEALGQLNVQLDRWLILLALPITRFAEYQAGAWQVPIVTTIAYSVGTAYTPELVRLFQARDPRGALAVWQGGIKKTALVVVPVTMALFVAADELISLLFTPAYAPAAAIFRCYSVLTFLRVASYGNLILAAGSPRFVVVAAGLGVFYNALFGIPFVLAFGFVGPAAGAACAFVVQVATYVFLIARAAEVSPKDVFPLGAYLRVLGLACVAGAGGWAVHSGLRAAAGLVLAAELVTVLGVFALLGTLTNTITRADWAYVRDWLKLKH